MRVGDLVRFREVLSHGVGIHQPTVYTNWKIGLLVEYKPWTKVAQILYNGKCQALSEILAYWYPSHQAFLSMKDAPYREENFAIRKEIIEKLITLCTTIMDCASWIHDHCDRSKNKKKTNSDIAL